MIEGKYLRQQHVALYDRDTRRHERENWAEPGRSSRLMPKLRFLTIFLQQTLHFGLCEDIQPHLGTGSKSLVPFTICLDLGPLRSLHGRRPHGPKHKQHKAESPRRFIT